MGLCVLAWPCLPAGLLFPTIIGTGLQEAISSASLLKSEIVAAGIYFWFFLILLNSRDLPFSEAMAEQERPALSPPFVRQDRRQYSVRLSAGCLDECDASCQPGMRSDRGHPGPRWAGVTQVTRLHRRPRECAGAWTVGLLCRGGAARADGNELQTLAKGPAFQVPPSFQEVQAFYWAELCICNLNTGASRQCWQGSLSSLIALSSGGVLQAEVGHRSSPLPGLEGSEV